MEKEVYNSFKLLRYKINELGNGYFIAQRPNGKQGLFDIEGKLIQGNMAEIKQISNEIYKGYAENKLIIFNRQGDMLEECLLEYTDKKHSIRRDKHCIILHELQYNAISSQTVYSLDGKAHFKDITSIVCEVIHNDGKYKLIYKDIVIEDSCYDMLKMLDTEGNIEIIDAHTDDFCRFNNHYIERVDSNTHCQITDYQGKVIYQGDKVTIDTKLLANDTIIEINSDCLKILSASRQIQSEYISNECIRSVRFTYNKNVICVQDREGMYLLNIKTMQKSNHYKNIEYFVNDIAVVSTDGGYAIYRVDLDSLRVRHSLLCEKCRIDANCSTIVLRQKNEVSYYTLDFRQLVNEI